MTTAAAAAATTAAWVYFVAYVTHWKVQWIRLCDIPLLFVRYILVSCISREQKHTSLRQVQRMLLLLLPVLVTCASAISLNWNLLRWNISTHRSFLRIVTTVQLECQVISAVKTYFNHASKTLEDTYRNVRSDWKLGKRMEKFVTNFFQLELSAKIQFDEWDVFAAQKRKNQLAPTIQMWIWNIYASEQDEMKNEFIHVLCSALTSLFDHSLWNKTKNIYFRLFLIIAEFYFWSNQMKWIFDKIKPTKCKC